MSRGFWKLSGPTPKGVRASSHRICPAQPPTRENYSFCLPIGFRRGRSTKSAASSASLRSVLRCVPNSARMVRPRAKSVTWIARTATGKSDGISPAVIPSRKRPSTSAAPPATASFRNCLTSASSTRGATHMSRHPGADPFSVALSTANLRKPAIESRRLCGERSAFAARCAFPSLRMP